jgi:hypothetical protein
MTFAEILQSVPPRLATISDEIASHQPAEGRWSKKEILGHLIDSAVNNHLRFVGAQFDPALETASYEQERWVAAQSYATEPWPDLVNLWLLLNRHLLHVIKNVPPEALSHTLSIGGRPAATLSFVIDDYVRHMEHHLSQILT